MSDERRLTEGLFAIVEDSRVVDEILAFLCLTQHTVTHWRLQKDDGIRMSFDSREVRNEAEARERFAVSLQVIPSPESDPA
jgi:hypothetical protein